jgi:hypothetical protein
LDGGQSCFPCANSSRWVKSTPLGCITDAR